MKGRSILTEHLLASCALLLALLLFLFIGYQLINAVREDGQLINLAGSLRYRSYKLTLLQREFAKELNPALKAGSRSLLQSEIEEFDKTLSQIRSLTKSVQLFPQKVRLTGLNEIDRRWSGEIKPLLLAIIDAPNGQQLTGRYDSLIGGYVTILNTYTSQLSMENRRAIERFTWAILGLLLFFAVSMLTITFFIRTRLIRPLELLGQAADQMGTGNFTYAMPMTTTVKEVSSLYRHFNGLGHSLQRMIQEQAGYSNALLAFNRASNEMAQLVTLEQSYNVIVSRAVEILHIDLAWLGLIEKSHQQIIPVASAGRCADLINEVRITWSDSELGQGPSGRAIRGMKPVKTAVDDPGMAAWREQYEQRNLVSLLSIPLMVREECIGVLALASNGNDLHSDQIVDICQVYANHAAAVIEDLKLTEYIIFSLARAAEANDEDTGNHILRVGEYCAMLAHELGLPVSTAHAIRFQATLHDVGKIHINPAVLKKNGPLTDEEWREMKQHPRLGSKIIGDHTMLALAKEIALSHHERWDGGGYPFGLKGDEIPLPARIMNIADQYDALRSRRAYKPPFDHAKTCAIILEGDGRTKPEHFDPLVLAAFRRTTDAFDEIYERLK